jgi:glycosyltransferase involved in cell wall biosynthesis
MKILQINKFLYPKGGSESYMFELSNALIDSGHEVAYWGMSDEKNIVKDTYDCFVDNIDFAKLAGLKKIQKALSTLYSFESQKKVSIVLDDFKPDIVHIHNYNFQLTPSILPEIKKRGIKIVYTAHDSQLVCPYHRLYNFQRDEICTKCVDGDFGNCIKNKCFDGSLMKSTIGTVESYLYHGLDYYNKYIDVVISPSQFLASFISKQYKKKLEVIPNFINKTANTIYNKENYILYFGRISNEKGIIEVLPLFEELKIPLLLIGSGPESNKIKESEYIQYIGPKYGDNLFEYISKAKYVIQPSKGYENCPMTVIESFACGTPIIAPNHSGFIDLIADKKNGFLIDFSSDNLKDKLRQIYELDTYDMQKNCIDTFNSRFTKKVHIPKIIDIYKRLLNESI